LGIKQYWRKLKQEKRKAAREEMCKDVEVFLEEVRHTRATNSLPDEAFDDNRVAQSTGALLERTNLDCRALLNISKKSDNLKGMCQRGISDAVASIRQCMSLLGSKNRSEETRQLEEEVRALRATNLSL